MIHNNTTYKSLSNHLKKALDILHKKYRDNEIVDTFNQLKIMKKGLTKSNFSKYCNSDKKIIYRLKINETTFGKILTGLDSIILIEFNQKWNTEINQYEQNKEEEIDKNVIDKLAGFKGVWIGYSWNRDASAYYKTDRINIFVLEFRNVDDIRGKTENAELSGKVKVIGDNTLALELNATKTKRRIYIMVKIGKVDSYKNIKRIRFAYVDSGVDNVRCGIAIIERRINEEFDNIAVGNYKIDDIKDIEPTILKKLIDTQHSAELYL